MSIPEYLLSTAYGEQYIHLKQTDESNGKTSSLDSKQSGLFMSPFSDCADILSPAGPSVFRLKGTHLINRSKSVQSSTPTTNGTGASSSTPSTTQNGSSAAAASDSQKDSVFESNDDLSDINSFPNSMHSYWAPPPPTTTTNGINNSIYFKQSIPGQNLVNSIGQSDSKSIGNVMIDRSSIIPSTLPSFRDDGVAQFLGNPNNPENIDPNFTPEYMQQETNSSEISNDQTSAGTSLIQQQRLPVLGNIPANLSNVRDEPLRPVSASDSRSSSHQLESTGADTPTTLNQGETSTPEDPEQLNGIDQAHSRSSTSPVGESSQPASNSQNSNLNSRSKLGLGLDSYKSEKNQQGFTANNTGSEEQTPTQKDVGLDIRSSQLAAAAIGLTPSSSTAMRSHTVLCGLSPLPRKWVSAESLTFTEGSKASQRNLSSRGDSSSLISNIVPTGSGSGSSSKNLLIISSDGCEVAYTSESKEAAQEVRTIKTDNPIPALCGIYYYEVRVVCTYHNSMVSVGFCTNNAKLNNKLPGHEINTWGYHSDDGKIMTGADSSSETHKFGQGDTVGCGVNFAKGTIFFTKNGVHLCEAYGGLKFAKTLPTTMPNYYSSSHTAAAAAAASTLRFNPETGLKLRDPVLASSKDNTETRKSPTERSERRRPLSANFRYEGSVHSFDGFSLPIPVSPIGRASSSTGSLGARTYHVQSNLRNSNESESSTGRSTSNSSRARIISNLLEDEDDEDQDENNADNNDDDDDDDDADDDNDNDDDDDDDDLNSTYDRDVYGSCMDDLEDPHVISELYPCIGFKPTIQLDTNFGEKKFLFDIERYVKDQKGDLMDQVIDSDMLPMGRYKLKRPDFKTASPNLGDYGRGIRILRKRRSSAKHHDEDEDEDEEDEEDIVNDESVERSESTGNRRSTSTPTSRKKKKNKQDKDNKLKGEDTSDFVKSLVSSYFSYMGYSNTAKAFKRECIQEKEIVTTAEKALKSIPLNEGVTDNDGDEMMADEDESKTDLANVDDSALAVKASKEIELDDEFKKEEQHIMQRQEIGNAIVNGDIHKAHEMIQEKFPEVFEDDDSLLLFKLRCHMFVELVKQTFKPGHKSAGENEGENEEFLGDLSKAIQYGETLRERYKNDQRLYVQDRLSQTFSLLAYPDPVSLCQDAGEVTDDSNSSNQESEVATSTPGDFSNPATISESVASKKMIRTLLGQSELYALADEINSAILVKSLKKYHGIPPLKRVIQNTMSLIFDLQNFRQDRKTSVLNVHQDYLY